ncbi:hypothetical protein V3C99_006502 [Haemonchus contortus]
MSVCYCARDNLGQKMWLPLSLPPHSNLSKRVSLVVRVLIKVCVRNKTNGRCGQIDGRNRLEVKLQILKKLYCTQI